MKSLTQAFRNLIVETIKDPDIVRASYIAKSAPSTHEIGWLGHKKFRGTKDKVQVKFDPNDPEIQEQYLFHTHPYEDEATPLHAMPSTQDLTQAAQIVQHGLKGIVIFSGEYYTIIVPTDKVKNRLHASSYEDALKRGDIEDAIKGIEKLGFDIETGKL